MKYGRKHRFRRFTLKMQRAFRNAGAGFRSMKRRSKTILVVGIAAAAAGVVLLVVFVAKPTLPPLPGQKVTLDEAQAAQAQPLAEQTTMPVPTPEPTPVPTPVPTPDPTLKQGMENEKVNALQVRLMDLGYLDIDEPTNLYGPATNYAVQLFQRQHGLEQDGVAGPMTLEKVYSDEAKMYTLLEGTEGNDVDLLQERLSELGYLGKNTGYYGSETVEAVKAFQERNDIGADGKTGQVTLDLIYSADALPTEEMANQVRRSGSIKEFLSVAENQLGEPYIWGASGPDSFDCSGLVTYCLRQAGSTTGRLNAAGFSQNSRWEKITDMDDMEIGDLIFFYNNGKTRVGHCGIYIGDGMMIDASSANGKVVKRSCRSSYWESHFVNARRAW